MRPEQANSGVRVGGHVSPADHRARRAHRRVQGEPHVCGNGARRPRPTASPSRPAEAQRRGNLGGRLAAASVTDAVAVAGGADGGFQAHRQHRRLNHSGGGLRRASATAPLRTSRCSPAPPATPTCPATARGRTHRGVNSNRREEAGTQYHPCLLAGADRETGAGRTRGEGFAAASAMFPTLAPAAPVPAAPVRDRLDASRRRSRRQAGERGDQRHQRDTLRSRGAPWPGGNKAKHGVAVGGEHIYSTSRLWSSASS